MSLSNCSFGKMPESGIELNNMPTPLLSIKQGPALYLNIQHLFKT